MKDVEERAERVLAAAPGYIWDGETLPVPVEELVDSVYGLLVRDVEDMRAAPGAPTLAQGQSLSGLLLPARGEIWVNAEEARIWPPRRRFTIGHELGHWVMHRDGQQALFCRRTAVRLPRPAGAGRGLAAVVLVLSPRPHAAGPRGRERGWSVSMSSRFGYF